MEASPHETGVQELLALADRAGGGFEPWEILAVATSIAAQAHDKTLSDVMAIMARVRVQKFMGGEA